VRITSTPSRRSNASPSRLAGSVAITRSGANLGGEAPHRRQHEMGALQVPALRRQLRVALDQQHAMRCRVGSRHRRQRHVQLVTQHPHRDHRTTAMRDHPRASLAAAGTSARIAQD
jgi:hypothetical protein